MSNSKSFAMLGGWHVHAAGYAKEINSLPGCRVAKVWDPDTAAAKTWAESLGCTAASLDDILADPDIEGVIVCCATNDHPATLLRAIVSGKAVFTEKVLTLRTADAEKIRSAVKERNTRFAISFPHFSEPWTQFALQAAASGKLGPINYARVRKAHNGATGNWLPPHFYDPLACGGGAMIDLGAHPMYLLCALLGDPVSVTSTFTNVTDKPVEDNAVSVLQFANGVIGVSETGFVTACSPFTIEVLGTDGGVLVRDKDVYLCSADTGKAWQKVDSLPERKPSPLAQWALAGAASDIPPEFGIDAAVRLTHVMEMAYSNIRR